MIKSLFPAIADNQYRGRWSALIFFIPALFMKAAIGWNMAGLNPYFEPAAILTEMDGIPLNSFVPEAREAILFFAMAWGFSMVLISLVGVLALVRYRALLPVSILLLLMEQGGRKAFDMLLAATGSHSPPAAEASLINIALTGLLIAAFVLSVIPRRSVQKGQNDGSKHAESPRFDRDITSV